MYKVGETRHETQTYQRQPSNTFAIATTGGPEFQLVEKHDDGVRREQDEEKG